MWFQKSPEELGEFSLERSKSEKLYIYGLFLSKAYSASGGRFQSNYVSWHWRVMQNLTEKLTSGLKNNIRNLVNFHASSRESGNLHFDGLLLSKWYKVSAKKVQTSYLLTLKCDAKFQEKLILGSKNDMRNLVNYNASSSKSENMHFDVVLLLSRTYKVSSKKAQKNCLSWLWKNMQTLKRNCFFVWKMTWGISWTLTWAVESLKTCALMGYFFWKYVMFELKNTVDLSWEKWLLVSKMT